MNGACKGTLGNFSGPQKVNGLLGQGGGGAAGSRRRRDSRGGGWQSFTYRSTKEPLGLFFLDMLIYTGEAEAMGGEGPEFEDNLGNLLYMARACARARTHRRTVCIFGLERKNLILLGDLSGDKVDLSPICLPLLEIPFFAWNSFYYALYPDTTKK